MAALPDSYWYDRATPPLVIPAVAHWLIQEKNATCCNKAVVAKAISEYLAKIEYARSVNALSKDVVKYQGLWLHKDIVAMLQSMRGKSHAQDMAMHFAKYGSVWSTDGQIVNPWIT